MKKVLSLVLVVAMVLSSFSFAFAAKFEDVTGDYEEAVNVLTALGVVTGYEDGTYRPERIVTRAEMAKLIVEILGYGDLVAGSKSNFADTQGHWADAWIALAAGRGLVIGTGDGKFTPDRQVSYDEAITMAVRALGYTDASNEIKGMTWPTNFKVKAAELKLLNGVKSVAGGADRGGVAQLLFNALDATLVSVTTDGDIIALYDTVDGEKEERLLLSRLAEKVPFEVSVDHVDADNKNYKGDVVDLAQYMYQDITVYEKDDVVVFVESVDSLTLKGTITDYAANKFVVEDAEEDEYTFADVDKNLQVLLNGEEVDYEDLDLEDAEVTVVLKGEDGDKVAKTVKQDVVGMVAKLATITVQAEEDYVKDEVEVLAFEEDVVLPVDDDEVDFDKLVVTGDADELSEIEEDDVLTLYYAKGKIADDVKLKIVVSKQTVEGKVTKVTYKSDAVDKVFIDGTSYKLNADFADDEIVVKDEGTFFLDFEGKLFSAKTESDIKPDNYALVLDTTNGVELGGVTVSDPKVKVLTAEGEKATYVIDLDDENEDIIANEADGKGVIVVNLKEGDLITYSLDDKEIDEADLVKVGTLRKDVKTNVNSFDLAKGAVMFSVPDYRDTDGAKVVEKDDLDDEIDAYVIKNEDGEISALIVVNGAGAEEKVYGIITANSSKTVNDDEEEVILYTAYVDGVKVEYLGLEDEAKITKLDEVGELTLSDGDLEAIDTVMSDIEKATGTASDSRVTASIKDTKGNVHYLSADVVVYVLDEDGEFDEVGTKNDIRGKDFIAYDTIDEDGDFDIVLVGKKLTNDETPDKTDLNKALATASAKEEADYTAVSWTAFQTALTAAKAMPEVTQAEVNAKLAAVNAAIAKLVVVEPVENTLEGTIEPAVAGDTILVDVDDATKVEKITFNGVELDPVKWEYAFDGNTVRIPVNAEIDEVVITIDGVDYTVVVK